MKHVTVYRHESSVIISENIQEITELLKREKSKYAISIIIHLTCF